MDRDKVLAVRTVARGQRGLFTLTQALECGFDDRAIRRWLSGAVWEEPQPRVYRFAGVPMSWDDDLYALTLSAQAVACGRSAAALYQLLDPPPKAHVLVSRGRRNLARVVVHSSLDIGPDEITQVGVIPATTPTRTVIDAASTLRREAVEQLVDRAVTRKLVRLPTLEHRARELRAAARPGAARVLRAIATGHPDLDAARNEFEAAMLRLSRRAGLPDPIPNYALTVGGQRRLLDGAWPDRLVCYEFDGFGPHTQTRAIFTDDRSRQNDLVDAHWRVFRFTWEMLHGDIDRHFAPVIAAVRDASHTSDPGIAGSV